MARQQRSTTLTQESSRPITQVALYARVSTLNNQDPEMQLAELREYAGRRGWQIVEEFVDQGVSGCKESRPALNRLMADACRRRWQTAAVGTRFFASLRRMAPELSKAERGLRGSVRESPFGLLRRRTGQSPAGSYETGPRVCLDRVGHAAAARSIGCVPKASQLEASADGNKLISK